MSRPRMSRWWLALVVASVWLVAARVHAHEFRPAVLELVAAPDGTVRVTFAPPLVTERGPVGDGLRPRLPQHCAPIDPDEFDCGAIGLAGEVGVEGLGAHPTDVLVTVHHADGRVRRGRLSPSSPALPLGAGTAADSAVAAFVDYLGLGARHIFGGADHLLLLLGLLLLARGPRSTVAAITGFSVGHAASLAAVGVGGLRLPSAPVETCIAISIVFVAVEIRRGPPSLGHAHPGTVAAGIGLLHGLGFADALLQLGVPAGWVAPALLGFNVGIEAGQLAVVLVVVAVAVAMRRRLDWTRLRAPLATGLGVVAFAWTIERALELGGAR